MNTVNITTSSPYPVYIGSGILKDSGLWKSCLKKAIRAVIISDSNVWPLYGESVEAAVRASVPDVFHFVFSAGESSKNGETFLNILNFLAEKQLTRTDMVIALGGGVTGDLAGFAAASYLRGVDFIQVPTTLLADVDSSVGGKTAIDLPTGKNLAGAFHQPCAVLCDTDTLKTLPRQIFLDGCAEVIKYGVLYDPELFSHLETFGPDFHREYVITRCVELKNQVVTEDEFDRGARQKLNLGHTIGHGIEKFSHYEISHGSAVGTGMAIVVRMANHLGLCSEKTVNSLLQILKKFGFALTSTFTSDELACAALSDKKRTGSVVNLILPQKIGDCAITPVPVEDLKKLIEAGL